MPSFRDVVRQRRGIAFCRFSVVVARRPARSQRGHRTVSVFIGPSDALARVPLARDLRLVSVAGRPVYVARSRLGAWLSIAGDTGEVLPAFSAPVATTVAERFARASAAGVSGPMEYDQWIVHQRFDPYRPFYRVRLNDDARTDLYVSARTGEVVAAHSLFGTRVELGRCGYSLDLLHAVAQKLPGLESSRLVGVFRGAVVSSVGVWLGFVRLASNRAAGRKGLSPFRGWMRWHHIIGLFASVIVVTWMLSGWLSMDHGRLFSRGETRATQTLQMRGMSVGAVTHAATLDSMREVSSGL